MAEQLTGRQAMNAGLRKTRRLQACGWGFALSAVLMTGSACIEAQQLPPRPESSEQPQQMWNAHGQATLVWQGHGRFRSPYEGENSLRGRGEGKETISITPSLGVRLLPNLL